VKINAGKLDRRLEILSRSSVGTSPALQDALGQLQDGLGQVLDTWTPTASTYAQRLELRTQDAARAGSRDTFAVSRFLIRYRRDLTTSARVRVDGILYDIRAIDEPDRRETMVLTVEEVVA
jgi:SPP1 family predicted phage head-tail adaptor